VQQNLPAQGFGGYNDTFGGLILGHQEKLHDFHASKIDAKSYAYSSLLKIQTFSTSNLFSIQH
jgi:hypothetical protein